MEQQPHAVIPAISLLIFLLNALSMITKGAMQACWQHKAERKFPS
jgi:hypothetical protein